MIKEINRVEAPSVASAASDLTHEPSAWDSLACSFWSIFDHKERDIEPVASEDVYNFPECDYDRCPTNLYKQIEAKNWTAVNHFLLTGYWAGSFFADSSPPHLQACTWVTKYECLPLRKRRLLWTHLPIHAAISGGAPQGTIQLLIKIAPPTLRCADDCRMLPLHLAFRRGAPDAVVASIMEVFPEGVAVRDQQGRTPHECAAEGPGNQRGTIIQTVLQFNQRVWEKKSAKAIEDHIKSTQLALHNKDERMEHLKTALDLVRMRDDLTSQAFVSILADLRRFNGWYEVNKPNLCSKEESLRAQFVSELSEKMAELQETAEDLRMEQKKRQKASDRTLANLNERWGEEGIGLKQMMNYNFDDILKMYLRTDELSIVTVDSDVKPKEGLVPSTTKATPETLKSKSEVVKDEPGRKEIMKAESSNAKSMDHSVGSAAKAKPEAVKANPKASKAKPVVVKAKEVTREIEKTKSADKDTLEKKDVPQEVSGPEFLAEEQDKELGRVISDMTSVDAWETQSYLGETMKSFRNGLKSITKTTKKKTRKVDSVDGDGKKTGSIGLPPKSPFGPSVIKSPPEKQLLKMATLEGGTQSLPPCQTF